MAKPYVQHISGQGAKWEVLNLTLGGDDGSEWHVRSKSNFRSSYALPKSEYRLCEPPVVWRDVTAECEVTTAGLIRRYGKCTYTDPSYRRRKEKIAIPGGWRWAIIIEQKVTE